MVHAVHFIFTAYGFWLSNDPRGSGSTYVGLEDLYEYFGLATKVEGERSVARRKHSTEDRLGAKDLLPREPIRFSGRQAKVIATGIGAYCARADVPVYALSVMRSHVHMVVGFHRLLAPLLLIQFKGAATRQLRAEGHFPAATPWGRSGRHRYIDSRHHLSRALKYVEENRGKEGLRPQRWSFVKPLPDHLRRL